MEEKVVVHLKDGKIHKGVTLDFAPGSESFHLLPAEGGGVPLKVVRESMKALFYVKDYLGNRDFTARRHFEDQRRVGRRAILTFEDGERIWGAIPEGEDPESAGFFFMPEDEEDNNLRIFVVKSSLQKLELVN